MLSNVRRKRVQRIDIESCDEFNGFGIWWFKDLLVYGVQYANLGNQRYSNETTQKSFEYYRMKPHLIPYCRVNDEIYNMILCPSGTFTKGSNDPQDNNPLEEKKIEKSFLLGETEITQELYYAVMGTKPSDFQNEPKNPVENVSWYDALLFCNRLSDIFGLDRYYTIFKDGKIIDTIEKKQNNYLVGMNESSKGFRLPTEWEWEYAAKAGKDLKYSGSNNVDEVAWYDGNSKVNGKETTQPVKQKNSNAWGFYDMSGNVWEWCENTWDYSTLDRVYRGGSWYNDASFLCSVYHLCDSPVLRLDNLGFRVCRYL